MRWEVGHTHKGAIQIWRAPGRYYCSRWGAGWEASWQTTSLGRHNTVSEAKAACQAHADERGVALQIVATIRLGKGPMRSAAEVAACFVDLAEMIEYDGIPMRDPGNSIVLHDVNGNHVGECIVIDEGGE
jgi:hypothetical protein